jgi:hypothetical protein
LIHPADRDAYRSLLQRTIRAGAHAVIATFASDGPDRCSGLDVRRYDPEGLATEIGDGFRRLESVRETHRTPWGITQPFHYSLFQRV